jgi:hypothetical protein
MDIDAFLESVSADGLRLPATDAATTLQRAAVWALTDLFLEPEAIRGVLIYEDRTSISPV